MEQNEKPSKAIRIVTIAIAISIIGIFLFIIIGGWWACNEVSNARSRDTQYLYEQIDKIEKECTDYSFAQSQGKTIYTESSADGDYLVKDENVSIKYDATKRGYQLKYKEKEILIDDEYMKNNSGVYYQVHHIWDDWHIARHEEKKEMISDVASVFVLTMNYLL